MAYDDKLMVATGDAENPGEESVSLETIDQGGAIRYDVVSKESDGLCPQLPNETATNKYLRQDGQWAQPENTTYDVVSKNSNGLCPQLPNETATSKYLRQDGQWAEPGGGSSYSAMTAAELEAGTSSAERVMRADYTKEGIKALMLELCYPVGSIYISTKNVSPQTFLGGTWKTKSGYMLRASTSSVYFNDNTIDGGADTVTISDVASHNHTQNEHSHKMNYGAGANLASGSVKYATGTAYTGTFSGNGTTATNQSKGSSYSISTLPKYKNVYMWERTA